MLSSRKLMLKNREHVFTYSIISLGFVFLLLSQSRVIWLVLLFGAVLFRRELFTLLNDLRSVLRTNIRVTIALVLCVVALIAMLLPRVIHSSLFFSEEGGGSLRIQMIQDGMPVLQSGPLLGYGVETSIYQLFQQVPKGYIQEFPFAIHNAYLQLAIEQGIIGMLLFFLPFIFVLRKILNTGQKLHSVSRKSMIVLIITVLGYYCLHPSYGRIEFPFLGLIMGILIYDLDSYQKNI